MYYKFTKHAIDRLEQYGLTEEDGQTTAKLSKWYTMPMGHLHHKLNTAQNQFGIVYYCYRKDKNYPNLIFTMREYKDHFLVITVTKKDKLDT